MSINFFGSLRNKLMLLVLLTNFCALTVASGIFLYYDVTSYRKTLINDMTTQIALLSYSSMPALQFDDAKVASENLDLLKLRPSVRAGAIYDAYGTLFASYVRPGLTYDFPLLPDSDSIHRDSSSLSVFKRVITDGQILGTAYMSADYDLRGRVLHYFIILSLVALAAMTVSAGLCLWLQSIITRPVLSIVSIAREVVSKNEYSRRAQKISEDEVGELVESFNNMLNVIEQRTVELENSNTELAQEIDESNRAQEMIEQLNMQLENKVLERTRQLESSNSELESFCHSVSHDLRGPLRSISGFSQALIEELPQQLPGDSRRYLDKILAATTRMGQLIEDLLNLSRVSRTELKRQQVDLSEVAREVLSELQVNDSSLHVDVSIWDGIIVEGDPKLLRIALENLLSNAWKFSSKNLSPKIEVGEMEDGDHKVYFVRDNGTGFDMKYADKLFGAFQRLHAMHEYPGTGVGLATVQRIVHRHGGRIWFNSSPGKGAVFYFTLKLDLHKQTDTLESQDA